jgi:hypothetical protein
VVFRIFALHWLGEKRPRVFDYVLATECYYGEKSEKEKTQHSCSSHCGPGTVDDGIIVDVRRRVQNVKRKKIHNINDERYPNDSPQKWK